MLTICLKSHRFKIELHFFEKFSRKLAILSIRYFANMTIKYENSIFDKFLLEPEYFTPFAIFFLVALAFLAKIFSRNKMYPDAQKCNKIIRGLEVIPTAKPLFPIKLIGNMPLLLPFTETLNKLEQLSKEHGDILKFIGLNQTIVFLLSGPLVQSILKSSDYGHVIKEPVFYDIMKPFISNGVLVSKGAFWKGQRKLLMRTQQFSSLKAYVEMLNRHSKDLVKNLQILFKDGETHQISALISTAFLKIISEMISGYDVENSAEFEEYHHNFQIWQECVMRRILNPLLSFNPIWKLHPLSKKYDRAVEALSAFAKRRIGEHRERRRLSAGVFNAPHSSPLYRSVLDELIDEGVDDAQIADEVNTMMFGGHETGASAIHFFCYAMACNPQIQQTCQTEIDQLFHREQDENLHFESLQGELKYVERCIQETLRLYPSVFIFFRKLSTHLDIERQGETIRLPSGTSVAIPPYLIHRKEEYYPDSYEFNPDRFLPEEQAKRPSYTYLPFSAGIRNCLGLKFAMMEMKTIAAHILRNFDISSTDKMGDIPLIPATTLTPQRDYMFRFEPRLAQ